MRIYDNGGKTADRYTVVYPGTGYSLGLSAYPYHLTGVHGWIGVDDKVDIDHNGGTHLGKNIDLWKMSPDAGRAAWTNEVELHGATRAYVHPDNETLFDKPAPRWCNYATCFRRGDVLETLSGEIVIVTGEIDAKYVDTDKGRKPIKALLGITKEHAARYRPELIPHLQ